MHEEASDHVELQALLYASGELEGSEAASFENRLALDQSAREALCHAVQLAQTLTRQPTGPSPAYRGRVQAQLKQQQRLWGKLAARRAYRGHPLVWTAVGAAAAVLLMLGWNHFGPATHPPETPHAPVVAQNQPDPSPETEVTPEMATNFVELEHSDRLEKAVREEARRKSRAEDRYRPGDSDARRSRILGKPSNR